MSCVLYIDDEIENLETFVDLFEDMAKIITANTFDEARQMIEEKSDIELIISDENMPDGIGSEFLTEVATSHPEIRRIIMTAHSHIDLSKKISEKIIHDVFFKPYDDTKIEKELNRLAS